MPHIKLKTQNLNNLLGWSEKITVGLGSYLSQKWEKCRSSVDPRK